MMSNINSLPNEVLCIIMKDLSYREVKAAGKTCERWSLICSSIADDKLKASEIKATWMNPYWSASLTQVTSGAALANRGFLDSVKYLNLEDIDISSLSSIGLAKLSKCISDEVILNNVTGDISLMLANIRCKLNLNNVSLTSHHTVSLVNAMKNRVRMVKMMNVTMDMKIFSQYDGKGQCTFFVFDSTNFDFKTKLQLWAQSVGWKTTISETSGIMILDNP